MVNKKQEIGEGRTIQKCRLLVEFVCLFQQICMALDRNKKCDGVELLILPLSNIIIINLCPAMVIVIILVSADFYPLSSTPCLSMHLCVTCPTQRVSVVQSSHYTLMKWLLGVSTILAASHCGVFWVAICRY